MSAVEGQEQQLPLTCKSRRMRRCNRSPSGQGQTDKREQFRESVHGEPGEAQVGRRAVEKLTLAAEL
jgi:hypothetical protein